MYVYMRRKETLPSTPHVVSPVTSYFFINYIEPLCSISKFKIALIKSADSECQINGSGFCLSGLCTINQSKNLENRHLLNYNYEKSVLPSHKDKKV